MNTVKSDPDPCDPPRWALPVVLMLAAALRALMLRYGHGTTLESDEAIFGLMGVHILENGARPVVYYGQQYMGALPAYLFAGAFGLFGVSTMVLKGVMLALDLGLVWAFHALGSALFSRRVGLAAAIFVAMPPAFLALYGLKARVFVEPILIGTLLITGATALARRAPDRRVALAAALGLVAGIGIWANTITAVYFPAVAMVWLLAVGVRGLLSTLLPAVAGALVGATPALLMRLGAEPGEGGHLQWVSAEQAGVHLAGLLETGWPIVAGARGPWAGADLFPGLGGVLGLIYLALAVFYGWTVLRERGPAWRVAARLAPPLAALMMLGAFCFSAYGREVREPRYLGALYPMMALLVAVPFGSRLAPRVRRAAPIVLASLLSLHFVVLARFDTSLLLPVSGGARVASSDAELIAALDALEIDAIYTDYWVAYRLAFETRERIVTSPFGHVVVERYPAYTAAVRSNAAPGFVLLGDAARGFGERLEREGMRHSRVHIAPYQIFYGLADPGQAAGWRYPF